MTDTLSVFHSLDLGLRGITVEYLRQNEHRFMSVIPEINVPTSPCCAPCGQGRDELWDALSDPSPDVPLQDERDHNTAPVTLFTNVLGDTSVITLMDPAGHERFRVLGNNG